MPQWKALPEGLDPDIRELTERLRRIVDGSGLDMAGLSVATGFGVTSWERYLDGRILPPQRAVAALAERTGTGIHELTSLRSRAERAWHRLEAGRDRATEQLRVARTREWASVPKPRPATASPSVPGALDTPAPDRTPDRTGPDPLDSRHLGADPLGMDPLGTDPLGPEPLGPGSSGPEPAGPETTAAGMPAESAPSADHAGAAGADSGPSPWNAVLIDDGGPATPPQAFVVPEGGGRAAARRARRAAEAAAAAAAGGPPPSDAETTTPTGAPASTTASASSSSAASASGSGSASGSRPGSGSPGLDKRRIVLFLSGVAGALVLIVAAVLFTDLGATGGEPTAGDRDRTEPVAKIPPSPSRSAGGSPAAPPAGVKCTGAECTGKNPEDMGCGGSYARTVSQATVGKARIEVRFSQVCQAAWARLVDASTGDSVNISVGGKGRQTGTVNGESDAYTPMTASGRGSDAKACAELTNGTTACTVVQ
ncbi:helix-turn-helix domain-containing protein [Streptomyces tsukubensis]|uniref:helix-turn-helix domain-containing protein n=1 Tax=Streptomyces tsukubensis TaxID=83656 RepID=UPI00344B5681